MRITAEAKQQTRARILETARNLFRDSGFDDTTTRDIARESGLATGTLFNYFRSKPEIVVALACQALQTAGADFDKKRRPECLLEEDLFAHVASQLRRLKPIRAFLFPAVQQALGPDAAADGEAALLREKQLERFHAIVRDHGLRADVSPVVPQVYWSLYTGVLAFWAGDNSPKQEATLALLDQSVQMFVHWLTLLESGAAGPTFVGDAT